MKNDKEAHFWRRLIPGLLIITGMIVGCVHDPFLDPTSLNNGNPSTPYTPDPNTPGCQNNGQVCFESSILPIFQSSCARAHCHDATSRKEGYILDNYNHIVRRGIKPGDASNSALYRVLLRRGEDGMPPDGPLSKAQIDSIALWINQGAKNTVDCNCFCDPNQFAFAADIEPIFQLACVGCHKQGNLSGNVNLDGYSNIIIQVNNGRLLGSISQQPGYSPMPKGGKLTDCEITKIKNWIDSGARNN